jgi:hypothetical protein
MVAQAASPRPPRTKALHRQVRRLDAVARELRTGTANRPAPRVISRAIEDLDAELAAARRQLQR